MPYSIELKYYDTTTGVEALVGKIKFVDKAEKDSYVKREYTFCQKEYRFYLGSNFNNQYKYKNKLTDARKAFADTQMKKIEVI